MSWSCKLLGYLPINVSATAKALAMNDSVAANPKNA
jgi:hypothetical protein